MQKGAEMSRTPRPAVRKKPMEKAPDFYKSRAFRFGGLGRNRTTDTRIFNRHPCVQRAARHTQNLTKTSTCTTSNANGLQSNAMKSTHYPTRLSETASEHRTLHCTGHQRSVSQIPKPTMRRGAASARVGASHPLKQSTLFPPCAGWSVNT